MLRDAKRFFNLTPVNFMNQFFKVIALLFLITASMNCLGLKPNPKFTEHGSSEIEPPRERPNALLRDREYASSFERQLTEAIESYLGVPYQFGGTTRSGMDCSGFVSTVYRDAVDLELPHRARSMFKLGRSIESERLGFGDLVFFENIENYGVSHVGIYVGDGKFAHASSSRGIVISEFKLDYYRKRYIGARRVYGR